MNKHGIIDLCSVFGKVETFAFGHNELVFSINGSMVLVQNRNELFVRDYESSSNSKHFCGRSFKKLVNTSTSCVLYSIRKALQTRKQEAI